MRGEYFWGPLQQQMIAARTVESDFDLVFTLTDALQSIIGVWNEDELRISKYTEYDPEGRISARAPDDREDCSERNLAETPCHIGSLPHFGFTGAFRSTTTGLYRFGARWYSSRFGQFMSPDPLWYVDSFDVYGYAAFDPVNRWDPSGMASKGMGDLTGSYLDGIQDSQIYTNRNVADKPRKKAVEFYKHKKAPTQRADGIFLVGGPAIRFKNDSVLVDGRTNRNTVEVWIWEGVGNGSSSLGHASIVVDNVSYSYGPEGMSISQVPTYEEKNLAFRSARVLTIFVTDKERDLMTEHLEEYNSPYNALFSNCVTPIRGALNIAGVDVDPHTPDGIRGLGGLEGDLRSNSRVSSERTEFTENQREGGAWWSPSYPREE
ncbi:RHS repeat-associated core domain-containing protein [Lujinxingia vulgaris]|uniref:RHS repeat-associated core domain-containing protein n=1 Tax=Lujinxingia vulgaris TaxID=2600176 RepID=A0A5C6X185_9DELT|nr:RHS repeat-associated core domain-containing protein [Lujinxingia vulgaris]TXD34868.1 RHS repeat-associated core domain-containing protein [Lujinxingia vulgaris]